MIRAIWLSPGDTRLTDGEALPRERRRFTGAMLVSGLVHALLLALLIGLWVPVPEETHAPIPITLRAGDGASGAAGGGNSTTAASAASAASESPSPSQNAEAQTPPAETRAPQPTEPPTAPPTPELAEAAEPVPPHKPAPPLPSQTIAQAQSPAPPAPATASSAASTVAPGSDAVTNEGAGGRGRGDEGAGRAAIGDGSLDGPGDDYAGQLQRWIRRYRAYPDEAIKQRQEGTVSIGFKLARDGTVLDAWIAQSSGFPLLDEAALKMIHAASPVPKLPTSFKGETATFTTMPETFHIGVFDRMFH